MFSAVACASLRGGKGVVAKGVSAVCACLCMHQTTGENGRKRGRKRVQRRLRFATLREGEEGTRRGNRTPPPRNPRRQHKTAQGEQEGEARASMGGEGEKQMRCKTIITINSQGTRNTGLRKEKRKKKQEQVQEERARNKTRRKKDHHRQKAHRDCARKKNEQEAKEQNTYLGAGAGADCGGGRAASACGAGC